LKPSSLLFAWLPCIAFKPPHSISAAVLDHQSVLS
jgi:hypothetical protein